MDEESFRSCVVSSENPVGLVHMCIHLRSQIGTYHPYCMLGWSQVVWLNTASYLKAS